MLSELPNRGGTAQRVDLNADMNACGLIELRLIQVSAISFSDRAFDIVLLVHALL